MFDSNTFKVPNVKLTLNSQCKQIGLSKISNHCFGLESTLCKAFECTHKSQTIFY